MEEGSDGAGFVIDGLLFVFGLSSEIWLEESSSSSHDDFLELASDSDLIFSQASRRD